mmetsp:Transcript_60728/g.70425  ORF Transcript_60728/g.70425 Transcript_60728/m.70425 type:complete len:89 (+) Transcript_60728:1250-1516(+)
MGDNQVSKNLLLGLERSALVKMTIVEMIVVVLIAAIAAVALTAVTADERVIPKMLRVGTYSIQSLSELKAKQNWIRDSVSKKKKKKIN